jgi:hypothetical protein
MSVGRQPNPMAGLPVSPPLAVRVAGGQLESAEARLPQLPVYPRTNAVYLCTKAQDRRKPSFRPVWQMRLVATPATDLRRL